ncbi:hypothetical protein BS17DRAFT_767481 [Gyrodon lividus]|nr:hypothetical protein BS17DRAFT_767481 [Gyrodon lividus]
MLFLPFIFHAGIGVLLLVHQFRNSPTLRRLKATLVPTVAGSFLPLFIESHFGDSMPESLSHGVIYLSRSTIALAASLVSPSGPTDIVLYDLHAMGSILDHRLEQQSRRHPRSDPPPVTRTEHEQYEAIIEEQPWVTYIPLNAEDLKFSPVIDPDNTAFAFATTEESTHSSTSPGSDPTPAIGEPVHQSSCHRPSQKRKSSRTTKKKTAGQKSQSGRKGRKPPAPTTWRDRLFKMVSRLRSRFAKLDFYPAAHFGRSWLFAFIHRHIKAFLVFSAVLYVGVELVFTAVKHIIFHAVIQDFLPHLYVHVPPRLAGLVVRLLGHIEHR